MENSKSIIMVVDDQADFVEGVKLILEEEGYSVWTASNGREALDLLTANLNTSDIEPRAKPLPDLILADIMMPIMDGYVLYEHTQANPHLKYIPFVFLTAKTEVSDIEHGKELGIEDYLTKPCLPDVLLASVRGQLRNTVAKSQPEMTTTEQVVGGPSSLLGSGITLLIVLVGVLIVMIGYWFGGG